MIRWGGVCAGENTQAGKTALTDITVDLPRKKYTKDSGQWSFTDHSGEEIERRGLRTLLTLRWGRGKKLTRADYSNRKALTLQIQRTIQRKDSQQL